MIVWKIYSVPRFSEQEEKQFVRKTMRNLLFSLHSVSGTIPVMEIVFLHERYQEISTYLLLRTNRSENAVSVVEQQLATAGYYIERLNYTEAQTIQQKLEGYYQTETYAVLKTEKIVTTPYLQEGYYYWSDPILYDQSGDILNSFSQFFQALLQFDCSVVSFQLFPSSLGQSENDALQYLNAFLGSRSEKQNAFGNGIYAYEPYAQSAYAAYHYYATNKEPLFQYNILVASKAGGSRYIADHLISLIKSESNNNPDLTAVGIPQVDNIGYEMFPFWMHSYIQKNCRDTFIWGGGIVPPNLLFRFPFFITADEALTFFHLPYDDGRLAGLRGHSYQDSYEIIPDAVSNLENISFGPMRDNPQINVGANEDDFSQHCLIVGMPGTGKTTFSINLLLQFYRKGIPFLAIEPTKAEYRAMVDAIPDLQVFTPGNNYVSPFVLNPFIPPKGVTTEKYIPSLFSAFRAAISMPDPLDAVFLKTIRACYVRYGWRDYSKAGDPEVTEFGFHEFIQEFKNIISAENYSKEIKGNLMSAGVLRLSNLIEQNKNIYDTVHSIPIEDLLSHPTVIELNAIDDSEMKAMLIAILLVSITAYIKGLQEEKPHLQNVVLIDEAHVLLNQRTVESGGKLSASNFAVQLVENMIAELRAYHTGIIIADQRPSAIGQSIVANTDIKIIFRLTEQGERELVGRSADMDDTAIQQLSQLDKGQAFVYYHRLKNAHIVNTPDVRAHEGIRIKVSDDEIKQKCRYWDNRQALLKPYAQCSFCTSEPDACDFRVKADAQYYCSFIWDRISHEIVDAKTVMERACGVPVLIKNSIVSYQASKREMLVTCVRIALMRKAAFEKNIRLNVSQEKAVLSYPINI